MSRPESRKPERSSRKDGPALRPRRAPSHGAAPRFPANPRAVAARAVSRVLRGTSLDEALIPAQRLSNPSDAALARAMAYGVLRELSVLQWLSSRLCDKPLSPDDEIACLLNVGLFQLRSLGTPPHAAINETVQAALALDRAPAQGFINAVLRRYTREAKEMEAALPTTPALRYSHPQWLTDRVRADWPNSWTSILDANNQPGPLTLRVNRRRIARDEYLRRLAEMSIAAQPVDDTPDAVMLAEARGVERIPGFKTGQVSVQDASAQLAAGLIDAHNGMRVLDACAAPGGKTAHLLECADVEVVAIDVERTRLLRVDENLRRLKLQAALIAGDAAETRKWWDHKPFDRILLDAPCSGTGVIRRHPDIKWLRRETDIAELQQKQLRLLKALWPLLKPGGRLIYATCSILRDEGDEVIKRFAVLHADVNLKAIDADWGEATECGRRIAPGDAHDGFYYSVLER